MKIKNYEALEKIIEDYFYDSTISASQLKEDLNSIKEHIDVLLQTIDPF